MLLCTKCGSYTSGTKCKLGDGCIPCRNKRALGYIVRRRHPTTGEALEADATVGSDSYASPTGVMESLRFCTEEAAQNGQAPSPPLDN